MNCNIRMLEGSSTPTHPSNPRSRIAGPAIPCRGVQDCLSGCYLVSRLVRFPQYAYDACPYTTTEEQLILHICTKEASACRHLITKSIKISLVTPIPPRHCRYFQHLSGVHRYFFFAALILTDTPPFLVVSFLICLRSSTSVMIYTGTT